MTDYIDVDVRPTMREGGEPFSVIMAALKRLEPGQGLRLYATFKPVPLFAVMADKGFAHSEQPLAGGEWEVLFAPAETKPGEAAAVADTSGFDNWPEPAVRLDNRDLELRSPWSGSWQPPTNWIPERPYRRYCGASRSSCFRSSRSVDFTGSAASRPTVRPTN